MGLSTILAAALLLVPLGPLPSPAVSRSAGAGRVYLTMEEALRLAFPKCRIEKQTVYLTREERRRAERLAKDDVDERIVRPYVATRDGALVGTAYFDAHLVRTLRETLMVVVDPQGRVQRVEVLAFAEPEDYVPREGFYAQFRGRVLDDDLVLERGIRGVTGATLTATATVGAVRRVLALHRVVVERGAGAR